MIQFPVIPAKMLLFGEHSVLVGLPAVTLPLWDFTSRLKFSTGKEHKNQSTQWLRNFTEYLQQDGNLKNTLDLKKMRLLLDEGLYLDSNIPPGYGLGSSASVCVAVFKAFYQGDPMGNEALRDFYGRMESYFHGKSSGIDPLVVHTEKPLLMSNSGIEFLKDNIRLAEGMNVYLLNSGVPRNSADMVNTFRRMYEEEEYKTKFQRFYQPVLNEIISTIIKREMISDGMLHELSSQQLIFFRSMIPENIAPLWQRHLSDGTAYFKILGAGGGGFFLVFSRSEYQEMEGNNMIRVNL